MSLKRMKIQSRLILVFVLVGAAPLVVSNIISFLQSSHEMKKEAVELAKIVAENKIDSIQAYFKGEADSIVDLAANDFVIQALKEFSVPFEQPVGSAHNEWATRYNLAATKFYNEQFGQRYFETNKKKLDVDNLVNQLDPLTLAAQYDFIFLNENPLGKKDLLVTPNRTSAYSRSHEKFHSYFRNFLIHHALYDVFLVNKEGRIVYTVFKETDFATSLSQGPWAKTSIARAFSSAMQLKPGEAHIEDFAPYTPSYDAPASFAATPIYADEKLIGVLMIQLPLDKISALANDREGLGEKGETLFLGSDLKLRADTFRNKSTHTVASNFDPNSKISVESEAVKKASQGETGYLENISYDGLKTLAYYQPIKIYNMTWYVITELSQDEVYAGLYKMMKYSFVIILVGVLAIAFAALLIGRSIARSLNSITQALSSSSDQVSRASSQSASSATELSEASTEQAASLQETMASAEEISAMVNQNADSSVKAQTAVSQNQKASEEGSKSVEEMVRAISEIKDTNEEVLSQMETSNREFSEIVKIISEIGEKTNVINEIVFQTKLLSFNASVEAARAGEHGKGFAVVAEEVGNLAQMSGNAAKEITDMLSDSIRKVNAIVENTRSKVDRLIETGKDKISMGQATAERCRQALNKITENARSISTMITEIAHASKEQSQGVQEINKAIAQLDQVTQQNSSVAQQSANQAEQLSSEAKSLSNSVHQLIAFVEGAGHGAFVGEHLPKVPTSTKPGNVVKMKPPGAKTRVKKAVNDTHVPSSNDPGFEEF